MRQSKQKLSLPVAATAPLAVLLSHLCGWCTASCCACCCKNISFILRCKLNAPGEPQQLRQGRGRRCHHLFHHLPVLLRITLAYPVCFCPSAITYSQMETSLAETLPAHPNNTKALQMVCPHFTFYNCLPRKFTLYRKSC